jgi:alpha-N-acetylglucosamine transferase
MSVKGDLSSATEARVEELADLLLVEDIRFQNFKRDGRYALNWVKIRTWELEQWDAILMLDSDVTVLGDLTHLFQLPTDFAAVPDNGKAFNRYGSLGKIQAGVIMLRPCAAVARHMRQLAEQDRILQFPYSNAEQDFFDWYFKYTAYTMPLEFNALADRLENNLTIGGAPPRVVHHTMYKPFKRIPGAPGHQFLCRDI